MELAPVSEQAIAGQLEVCGRSVPVHVLQAASHTLFVRFLEAEVPDNQAEFETLRLRTSPREVSLGRCRYHAHAHGPLRRQEDARAPGDGRIVFLEDVYDFSSLTRSGRVFELKKRLEQLPVLWGRKHEIRPAFREYVAALVYDLQVYRSLFDEVDRNLKGEPPAVRADVQRVVCEAEYPAFCALFERMLSRLQDEVAGFSKDEHERHGFYLRKHVWDVIRASEFLLRTNLKPRGYAGDSHMMRMVYENQFRGPTIFSRFVHRHPLQTAAAQAVRNRVGLLSQRIGALSRAHSPGAPPLRLMSVAAGPAYELSEVLRSPADFQRFEVTLLDQDTEALGEAHSLLTRLETQHGARAQVRLLQESVRTMLRTPDLAGQWGRFHLVYSMGLFDYLTAPVARVVLEKLYSLLEPGGELVVGNFHVANPTRLYMEYWMDWVLLHRSEEQMLELARGLPEAHASVAFEETGSQMFLCVRKGGR